MSQLQPASGVSLTEHLETVARENSIGRFEDQMLDFLGALLESVDRPDLDQLERGQFTGVSPEEAEEILRHVRSQGVN